MISALNKQKFGDGFLQADYKRDREEEQNIGPEDIDPLTLYVGNLAQDILKDDLAAIYPTAKRIDIGFAKKMKFTRYAFVTYKNVDDCIEAFRKTHNTELYARSLIVRFRRLHGTVGMPGEAKPQNTNKRLSESDNNLNNSSNGILIPDDPSVELDKDNTIELNEADKLAQDNEVTTLTTTDASNGATSTFDLNRVKEEPNYTDYDDNIDTLTMEDVKPPLPIKTENKSRLTPTIDAVELFSRHKPMIETTPKEEPKENYKYPQDVLLSTTSRTSDETSSIFSDSSDNSVKVKSEPNAYINGNFFFTSNQNK